MSWLNADFISPENSKYVYATAGGIVGGVMFGVTGSWHMAITWDVLTAFACWVGVRASAPMGGLIGEFLSFSFRLLTFRL